MPMLKKTALATAMTLGLGIGVAQAAPVAVTGVFTMYDSTGGIVGVDSTVTGFYDHDAMTFGVSSTQAFFGQNWTASGGTLYAPGSYNINVNGDGADQPAANGDGSFMLNVGAGEVGGNVNFAWGPSNGIDVFLLWDSTGASLDVDGDGIPGAKMIDGPFIGFSASFALSPSPAPVPVPAAVWLFGSGLLGLVGIARRRKASV